MTTQRELHAKRLREGFEGLDCFDSEGMNAWHADFKSWKERVAQSLGELFSKEHDYYRRFNRLSFWKTRISFGGGSRWSRDDQRIFDDDKTKARQVLTDALEELDLMPADEPTPQPDSSPRAAPTIVVNVQNVLSQTTHVEIGQLLATLDVPELRPQQRKEVEALARDLDSEAKGDQRWPVLARSLEGLKKFGKSVYEKIAIPILLEMLKQQAGL